MARIKPEDWQPPVRSGRGGSTKELAEAVALARANVGRWIEVGDPRELNKPPTSWVSEVNGGRKTIFQSGEKWEATYEVTAPNEYQKVIRLVSTS